MYKEAEVVSNAELSAKTSLHKAYTSSQMLVMSKTISEIDSGNSDPGGLTRVAKCPTRAAKDEVCHVDA